jgi:hypothetical protein
MRKHDGGGIRREGGLDNPAERKGYGGPLAFRKLEINYAAGSVKISDDKAFFSDGPEKGREHRIMAVASLGNPQI